MGRICPIESHVGVVPNQGPRDLSIADCLLLVGDSAGHVNPLLLEGIRFALKYGRLAGKIANKAINKEAVHKSSLEEYEKRWKLDIWSDFQIGMKLQSRYLRWSDEQWDKEVAFIKSLSSTDMINLFKCNFSLKNLIKLASKYPRLRDSAFFSVVSHKKA